MDIPPHNHAETDTNRFLQDAFNAPNNRCIVFTAVRNEKNVIVDFKFSLLSPASLVFFNGEDVTGKYFTALRPDQHEQLKEMIEVVETGVANNWERLNNDVAGIYQWYSVSDTKVGDGIVRVWENITARRTAEKDINATIAKKAEEKYLSLFNSIDQGFCIIEVLFDEKDFPYDYKFIDYNPAFEKQTGLVDARGKTVKGINPYHEQHWFDLYGGIAKNRQPLTFEQEAILINGWYEVSAFPLTKEKDNKVAVIFNDVSVRKKAELELNAFNSRLEEEVKERTAKLNLLNELLEQKNEELKKSNKELESFNYVASHDLQEPLRKIQTFLSLITQRSNDKVVVQSYMDKISSTAGRMSNLIQDVLTYSRINVDDQFTQIDLNTIIDKVLFDYELLISEKNAVVNRGVLPVINAIPLQMHQLFSNLISNSLKYNDGQPVITISSKKLDTNPPMVQITLGDNGIGFDPQYSNQIFELFKRLHSKSEYSGTGIGLSICKKIAEQHHGTIEAASNQGTGALFTIQLPV
ncbi:sensor histidine kinase [Flavobacterium rivuli]|uniref:sensor histidine kinase n=1 Tax=Flavobacterium rivuli TaxID=498301 RepID=UPI000368D2E0|nr:PAS domain-containing sensor histidine kinase [Flavobacterium rivuli]